MTTTKQSWLKRSLAVLLAVMMVMSMGVANVFAAGTDEVSIPDANLKAAINRQLAKQTGSQRADDAAVTEDDMASLTELVAENAGITDLTGLEKAINLETLDLSGNDLWWIGAEYSQLAAGDFFESFTKIKHIDLSDCNIGGDKGTTINLNSAFKECVNLETLDLSGNSINGIAGFVAADNHASYTKLKTVDLSDNNFYGFVFSTYVANEFESLEKIDLTENRIWADEASTATENWYQALIGSDLANKVDLSNQKSLLELHGLWLEGDANFNQNEERINWDEKSIDLGSVVGDSVDFALSYYGEFGALNVQVVGTDIIKMVDNCGASPETQESRTKITLPDLQSGENTVQLLFTHATGETMTWTAKVVSYEIPNTTEDSAGIVDPALYEVVLEKLGKEPGYEVTKDDMASLTGTLKVDGDIENAEGVQYATGLSGLNLKGKNLTQIPDLTPLKDNLTSLNLKGPYTQLPVGLEQLENLTTLRLQGAGTYSEYSISTLSSVNFGDAGNFPTPDLSKMTKLKNLTIASNAMETSVTIPTDSLTSVYLCAAKDGTLPDLTGKKVTGSVYIDAHGVTNLSEQLNKAESLGTMNIANLTGNVDLSNLKYSKTSITLGADCSAGDVVLNLDGLVSQNGKNNIDVKLTTIGEGTLRLKGSITSTDKIEFWGGNYILEDGFATPNVTSIVFKDGSCILAELPESFSAFQYLEGLEIGTPSLYKQIIPSNFNNCPALEKITVKNANGLILAEDVDWTQTALTRFTTSACDLVPQGKVFPETLEEITLNGSFKNVDALNGIKTPNLTSLKISGNEYTLSEFPYELVKGLPSLTTLYVVGRYPDIPEDTFSGSSNLKKVTIGSWLKADKAQDGSIYLVKETDAAKAIEVLKRNCPDVSVSIITYNETLSGTYSGLLSLSSDFGETVNDPFVESELTLYVPSGSEEVTITPHALYEDTTITVDGRTYQSGEDIIIPLNSFSETITLTTHNDFVNFAGLPTDKTYSLSIIQGEVMESFIPKDGGVYNLNYQLLVHGSASMSSMANNYVTHLAEIRYHEDASVGQKYDIRFVITNLAWITDMKYRDASGNWQDAETIFEDPVSGTRTYRIYADNIENVVEISPYVVPMSKWPTCDMRLDLTSAVDISGAASVDKADLNAAINKAVAITEKRNVYTDTSWKNFMEKLEAAQTIAENGTATQDAVNNAAKELETAMTVGGEGSLVIDESKLANKTALETAINEAKALQQGNHTDTAWNALQEAISDAQTVYDTLEASQTEVDTAAKSLNTAVTLFQNSGEASELDKNNLEDGVYSVYGEMIKTNREEKSMSNDAINHYIKLTVEDGKYYLNMDFHGLAYLNKFGYLAELSYYDDGYTYGQYGTIEGTRIAATVLSTQKNADGSDLYDEFNQTGGSYEGKLYPDQIKFPLVADALADEEGYVPLHVFVPVMEDISAGTGDQDVLLKLDWSTLTKTTEDDPNFEPEEPVEQSPAVDFTDSATGVKVNADKGVFDEGVQIVVSEITQGADYDAAVSSLSDVGKKFKLYDVKFLDADGNEVTPNGTVSISLPITAGYDSTNLAVYRLADGGKVLVKGAVQDGYYTVITKTAGTYALVEKGSTITDAENTENADNGNQNQGGTGSPQTGDASNVGAIALLALAAAGMMGVTLVTRKRKSEEA